MANDFVVSTDARNAMLDAFTALLNVGGPGTIEIYSGAKPAGPATAVGAQVKLVTLTFGADAFGNAATGVATAGPIATGTAIAAGTATWFRAKDGAGAAKGDGTVGTSASDINLPTVTISVGLEVSITSLTVTHPA